MLNYSVVWWSSDVEDERKRQNVQKAKKAECTESAVRPDCLSWTAIMHTV